MRWAMRRVRTVVLPVPAPATIRSGPSSWVTASRWAGFSPSRMRAAASSGPGRALAGEVRGRTRPILALASARDKGSEGNRGSVMSDDGDGPAGAPPGLRRRRAPPARAQSSIAVFSFASMAGSMVKRSATRRSNLLPRRGDDVQPGLLLGEELGIAERGEERPAKEVDAVLRRPRRQRVRPPEPAGAENGRVTSRRASSVLPARSPGAVPGGPGGPDVSWRTAITSPASRAAARRSAWRPS